MMSIRTIARSGVEFDEIDGLAPGGGGQDPHAPPLQHARQRENIAGIVVDQKRRATDQILVRRSETFEHPLLFDRQIGNNAVQEQRSFVEQPLGQFHALDHDAARHGVQLGVFLRGQFAAGEHHDRDVREARVGPQLLQHLESGHVGQPQVEHHAIAGLFPDGLQRLCAGCRR